MEDLGDFAAHLGRRAGEHRASPAERSLRREAMQIAVQLPESADEALRVLEYARALVLDYIEGKATERAPNERERLVLKLVT